jgi:hypothetical protein
MFKDRRLLDPAYRGDHFLLNVVAHLALEPDLAALMTRRHVARGLDSPATNESADRVAWRVFALGAVPFLVVAFGAWRALRDRRSTSRTARRAGAAA